MNRHNLIGNLFSRRSIKISRIVSECRTRIRLGSELPGYILEDRVVPAGQGTLVQMQLTGAIFTTDINANTNVNIFSSKDDVYLNGGPRKPGAAGLPDGNYYVKVTDPSGAVLLGQTPGADVKVVGGEFMQLYQLSAILQKPNNGGPGYNDTPNNGGEYKVWVSKTVAFY